jgi:hypothetical protein
MMSHAEHECSAEHSLHSAYCVLSSKQLLAASTAAVQQACVQPQ